MQLHLPQEENRSSVITARNLLQTAVGLLTKSPLTTVTVVAPALVLMCGVSLITATIAPGLLQIGPGSTNITTFSEGVTPLALVLGFALSYALMAILWHRHTLCGRCTTKPLGLRIIAGYLWRVVALALIQLAASLTMVIPLMILHEAGNSHATPPSTASMLLTTFVSQTVILWLLLRLSLILPAAALGASMPMTTSWKHTKQIARALWGVAAALALLNTCFTALATMLALGPSAQAMVFELPVYVIDGLLIFSVLTTLYSRLVPSDIAETA
ncbi:MAG: hypothetical protein ABJN72_04055 [Sulfitobacter sp.]